MVSYKRTKFKIRDRDKHKCSCRGAQVGTLRRAQCAPHPHFTDGETETQVKGPAQGQTANLWWIQDSNPGPSDSKPTCSRYPHLKFRNLYMGHRRDFCSPTT